MPCNIVCHRVESEHECDESCQSDDIMICKHCAFEICRACVKVSGLLTCYGCGIHYYTSDYIDMFEDSEYIEYIKNKYLVEFEAKYKEAILFKQLKMKYPKSVIFVDDYTTRDTINYYNISNSGEFNIFDKFQFLWFLIDLIWYKYAVVNTFDIVNYDAVVGILPGDTESKDEYNERLHKNFRTADLLKPQTKTKTKSYLNKCIEGHPILEINVDGIAKHVCNVCDIDYCFDCLKPLPHTCYESDVASVKEIRSLPKCVACFAPIFKYEGCSHVVCLNCHCTMEMVKGNLRPLRMETDYKSHILQKNNKEEDRTYGFRTENIINFKPLDEKKFFRDTERLIEFLDPSVWSINLFYWRDNKFDINHSHRSVRWLHINRIHHDYHMYHIPFACIYDSERFYHAEDMIPHINPKVGRLMIREWAEDYEVYIGKMIANSKKTDLVRGFLIDYALLREFANEDLSNLSKLEMISSYSEFCENVLQDYSQTGTIDFKSRFIGRSNWVTTTKKEKVIDVVKISKVVAPAEKPVALFDSQIKHAERMLMNFGSSKVLFDRSPAGSGKTHTAAWLIQQTRVSRVLLVLHNKMKSKWAKILTSYGITNVDILVKSNINDIDASNYAFVIVDEEPTLTTHVIQKIMSIDKILILAAAINIDSIFDYCFKLDIIAYTTSYPDCLYNPCVIDGQILKLNVPDVATMMDNFKATVIPEGTSKAKARELAGFNSETVQTNLHRLYDRKQDKPYPVKISIHKNDKPETLRQIYDHAKQRKITRRYIYVDVNLRNVVINFDASISKDNLVASGVFGQDLSDKVKQSLGLVYWSQIEDKPATAEFKHWHVSFGGEEFLTSLYYDMITTVDAITVDGSNAINSRYRINLTGYEDNTHMSIFYCHRVIKDIINGSKDKALFLIVSNGDSERVIHDYVKKLTGSVPNKFTSNTDNAGVLPGSVYVALSNTIRDGIDIDDIGGCPRVAIVFDDHIISRADTIYQIGHRFGRVTSKTTATIHVMSLGKPLTSFEPIDNDEELIALIKN